MQIVCALWHKKRTPTQAAGLCHNRARERESEERCQAGQMHAVRSAAAAFYSLHYPRWLWLRFCIHSQARKFPHFPAQFFLLDFCLATFFHIIKADYLGRRGIVQRVLFVSMHVRKCTGQWNVPAPPLSLPLSLCVSVLCNCIHDVRLPC